MCATDAQPENNILLTWEQRLAQMSSISNFDDLQEYINSNPLPIFKGLVQQDMTESDKSKLDFVALHHLPQDAPDSVAPISVDGDGNCFPRSVSYILQKHEERHKEMRVRIVYEAIQNMDKYLGAQNFYGRATLVQQFAMYTEEHRPNIPLDVLDLYRKEVMEKCKLGDYCGIWQIFQTANILRVPTQSVYPVGCSDLNTRKDMNRTVYCYNENNNANEIK